MRQKNVNFTKKWSNMIDYSEKKNEDKLKLYRKKLFSILVSEKNHKNSWKLWDFEAKSGKMSRWKRKKFKEKQYTINESVI